MILENLTSEYRAIDSGLCRYSEQWVIFLILCFGFSLQNLEFYGVMRFYFQGDGEKVSTKCVRVASTANTTDVINTLVEKFRPDMRMLSLPSYALYEVHITRGEFMI